MAVPVSYFVSIEENPVACVCDFVGAHHAVVPLRPEEINLLPDLIVARLVTSITMASWRAERYSQNPDYILRNNGPARRALLRLAGLPRAEVTRALQSACDME